MSTTTSTAPAPAQRRGSSPVPQRPEMSEQARARFEANLAATRNEAATRRALAIAKLLGQDVIECPECHKPAQRGKFKIHQDGGWKHFSSNGCHGDAVSVLQAVGIPTGDAIRVLNGLPTRTEIELPADLDNLAAQFVGVKSSIDLEVFNGVLVYARKTGGVQAAQEFYSTWHIAPEAVEAWGAVYISDPAHFARNILARFGAERLIACGLFVPTKYGSQPHSLVSESFPVIEPHRHPATGDVLYMQLRGSHAQYARYLEHKADPENVPYKKHEKFISLRGAPRAAQVGCGLPLIERLEPGSIVHIVEGLKDGMAGHTLGLNAYAIPGVDFRPPPKICRLLARHTVLVTLDGDDAGVAGRDGRDVLDDEGNVVRHTEGLVEYLRRNGVDARPANIGPAGLGLDVTDYLVAGHASGKFTADGVPCPCPTCAKMRAGHPEWFGTKA